MFVSQIKPDCKFPQWNPPVELSPRTSLICSYLWWYDWIDFKVSRTDQARETLIHREAQTGSLLALHLPPEGKFGSHVSVLNIPLRAPPSLSLSHLHPSIPLLPSAHWCKWEPVIFFSSVATHKDDGWTRRSETGNEVHCGSLAFENKQIILSLQVKMCLSEPWTYTPDFDTVNYSPFAALNFDMFSNVLNIVLGASQLARMPCDVLFLWTILVDSGSFMENALAFTHERLQGNDANAAATSGPLPIWSY